MLESLYELNLASRRARRLVAFAVAALTVLGLFLRLASARGDLWLDEIWSLRSLERLHRAGEILWGLPFDNNHILNSLWLWIVGPHAPPVLIRLESIVVGTLTVPMAARFCGRAGPVAAIAGAALAALGAIFVQFGSEARGYAGLLLMIFVAADALEDFILEPSGGGRVRFAGAVALGAFFHLTMLFDAAILAIATLLRLYELGRPRRQLVTSGVELAFAGVLGALPAVGFLATSVLSTHSLHLGTSTPFSFTGLAHSLTTIYAATLGLPYDLPIALTVFVCAALTLAAIFYVGARAAILPLTSILLPALFALLAQAPNVQYPRFFLIATLGLVVLTSRVAAKLWSEGQRLPVACVALLLILGNGIHAYDLIRLGRGDIQTLVARMEAHGASTFATNLPAETWVSLHFYDPRGELREVRPSDWCGDAPDWYVLTDRPALERPVLTFAGGRCRAIYEIDTTVRRAPLSGLGYALYRRPAS